MSFLQQHYNANRNRGVEHAIYLVENDIGKKVGNELKAAYEKKKNAETPRKKS